MRVAGPRACNILLRVVYYPVHSGPSEAKQRPMQVEPAAAGNLTGLHTDRSFVHLSLAGRLVRYSMHDAAARRTTTYGAAHRRRPQHETGKDLTVFFYVQRTSS